MLVLVEVEIAAANPQVAEHAVGGGEFGHDQAASAKMLDEAAKNRVGDARHRSEHRRRGNRHVTDAERAGKGASTALARNFDRRSVRTARILPELLHSSILRPFSAYVGTDAFVRPAEAKRGNKHKSH